MEWTKLRHVSYQRWGHTANVFLRRNAIYLFGGYYNSVYFNDIQKYDITYESLQIVKSTGDSPSPRYSHGSLNISDMLFVFGGYCRDLSCNDIYNFNPTSR